MSDRTHIGLDNPAFSGRLRQPSGPAQSSHDSNVTRPSARYFNDFVVASSKQGSLKHRADTPLQTLAPAVPVTQPQPIATPKPTPQPKTVDPSFAIHRNVKPVKVEAHKPQRSEVLLRQPFFLPKAEPEVPAEKAKKFSAFRPFAGYTKLQYALTGMAVMIFALGLGVSAMTFHTNRVTTTKVAAIAKAAVNQPATNDATAGTTGAAAAAAAAPPSTVKPTPAAVSNYAVGPNLPRYLDIPKLGVHARVLSLGILNNGELATPNNVYDTGWYNETSQPGQPGAMLFDGHVSSWTAHGVFYGIKTLVAGDTIQVERGDGQVFTYQVVKSQVFDADSVDMKSAVTPVDPSKPGLNLITCTGQVIKGTNEFDKRVLVYATQV